MVPPQSDPTQEHETDAAEIGRIMLAALTEERSDTAQVTMLACRGVSTSEIAKRLGMPKREVSRARAEGRALLSELGSIMQS